SAARTLASWISPPFVAQYAARPGDATRPSWDAIRITLPPPRAIMAGIAAFTIKKAPVRLTRITRSHAASSISSTVAARSLSAAPYRSTSRPPKRSTVAATAARQLAPSVTSRGTGSAGAPPRSISAAVVFAPVSSTSAQVTAAPAAANASAVARPIPFAAPTTIATFFSSVNVTSVIPSPPELYRVGGPRLHTPLSQPTFDETARGVKGPGFLALRDDPRALIDTGF